MIKKLVFLSFLSSLFLSLNLISFNSFADDPANSSTNSSTNPINQTIAIVNDGVITQVDLNQAVFQTLAQAKMSGITPPPIDQIKPQVLDQLILQKIAIQLAVLNNLTVSEDEIDQAIADICQQNNTSAKELKISLENNGISFDQYKNLLKNKLLIRKLEESAVANSIIISDQDVTNYLNTQKQNNHQETQYTLSHILISLPDNPTPADIQKAQEKSQDVLNQIHKGLSFTTAAMEYSQADDALQGGLIKNKTLDQLPTLFEQPLSSMKVGDIVGPLQTSNGFYLLQLISENTGTIQPHFMTQYHVQMILIKTNPIITANQAKTQLLGIYNAIRNGESFNKLAMANSQDYDSASKGGDLGWVSANSLPLGLGAYVESLKTNEVSKPINIGDSWYLVKSLGQRQQEDTQAYQESQAREVLFQQKAMKAVQAWQTKLRAESYIKILD